MTRNGIEYDLAVTPYRAERGKFTFYFSSAAYLQRFEKDEHCTETALTEKLSKKFGVEFNLAELAKINLYSAVEKRGFLISYDGRFFNKPKGIKLNIVSGEHYAKI